MYRYCTRSGGVVALRCSTASYVFCAGGCLENGALDTGFGEYADKNFAKGRLLKKKKREKKSSSARAAYAVVSVVSVVSQLSSQRSSLVNTCEISSLHFTTHSTTRLHFEFLHGTPPDPIFPFWCESAAAICSVLTRLKASHFTTIPMLPKDPLKVAVRERMATRLVILQQLSGYPCHPTVPVYQAPF